MKFCLRVLPLWFVATHLLSVSPVVSNTPLRVVIQGERLGSGLSASNLLWEGSDAGLRTSLVGAVAALAGTCAAWVSGLGSGEALLCGAVAGALGAGCERLSVADNRVMLGAAEIGERVEFAKNFEYVPLLRHLLQGGALRVKATGRVIHRPDVHLQGVFSVLELPTQGEGARGASWGDGEPRVNRVPFVGLESAQAWVPIPGAVQPTDRFESAAEAQSRFDRFRFEELEPYSEPH